MLSLENKENLITRINYFRPNEIGPAAVSISIVVGGLIIGRSMGFPLVKEQFGFTSEGLLSASGGAALGVFVSKSRIFERFAEALYDSRLTMPLYKLLRIKDSRLSP